MFTIGEYVRAQSLDEAFKVLKAGRNNVVLGGCLWLKMGRKAIGKAIDLSALGLDFIRETDDAIEIGAMTPLSALEHSALLKASFGTLFEQAGGSIVGTQFRNTATVGGTVYGRYGFSDILTALMVLDTHVKLYEGGMVPLEEFARMPYQKDIVEYISIRKAETVTSYQSMRNSATDFPILTAAAAQRNGLVRLSVGARPAKAKLCFEGAVSDCWQTAKKLAENLDFASNLRASAEYRKILCEVLVKRALEEVLACR